MATRANFSRVESSRLDPKKPTRHGFIEPGTVMTIAAYQIALAATAPVWQEVP
jgi:hypothetical protein